jgi:glycine/D-amino acid oxidase-like deaminating enzyme
MTGGILMKNIPFWTDNTPDRGDFPISELPPSVDIAIIGSGVTGLNAAIAMLRAGATVAVVEQEVIGWGASSRNGGLVGPGLKPAPQQIEKKYGIELVRQLWHWSYEAVEYVVETIHSEEIDCALNYSGQLYLASTQEHWEEMQAYLDYLHDRSYRSGYRPVEPADLPNEIGSPAYFGGLVDDVAGGLDPARYVYGLARVAAELGGMLVENTRVQRISRHNGKFSLSTNRGEISAKEVLMATNGYTTGLVPRIRQGIIPVGSYIIITEPLTEDLQREISPRKRVFFDSRFFLNYFWLTPYGRLLFGGRANLSTNLDLQKSARGLQKRMLEVFPQLEGVTITHSWTGKLGVSFDMLPHLGKVNGVYYAMGYSGHGVPIGSYLGCEVGEMMVGARKDSIFLELDHPRFVLASWDKLYLPFITAYFRSLVRLGIL